MADFDDKHFWIGKRGWPADAYDYVFPGRAVLAIGRSLFPSEWTGQRWQHGIAVLALHHAKRAARCRWYRWRV